MRLRWTAVGIVTFQAILFGQGFVYVGARLNLVAEQAEIVSLARHLEGVPGHVRVRMASRAFPHFQRPVQDGVFGYLRMTTVL